MNRVARTTIMRSVAVPCRMFAADPIKGKEKGDEKVFFNKEDEKVLRNLMKKLQAQTKATELAPKEAEKQCADLQKIFTAHKIDNKALFDALVEWKKQI